MIMTRNIITNNHSKGNKVEIICGENLKIEMLKF